ncbi:acylamino-acid-releasing enzyme-like isoform X2 [Myxocyprinus asiaticus]|uniref:acylamino-acid-releasing enzyme-like isoform X2 n=1 Tax=Myxocyprinus asiaticus TaxID=70543 RepID=UPI0022223138|nr:acylamino-acid-releasing enzyme-like isoform X2 [Myxocyprinus asiaticus]
MFSCTSQLTELHRTILRGEEQPVVKRCVECCSLYHCPYCGPDMFKPTIKSKCLKHLQGHRRRAIRHKEFFIFKCHLKCRTAPHFHCISCTSTFMRKDGFLKHLLMCESKKPKVVVVEVKSEESSPASETVTAVSSEAGSAEDMTVSDRAKSLVSGDTPINGKRKVYLVQHSFPEQSIDEQRVDKGPTCEEMAVQGSENEMVGQGPTADGDIVEGQMSTDKPSKASMDEGKPSVVDLSVSVGDHNVCNSAENPHPTETDVAIRTLVNEISGHTPVESTVPLRSRSDTQDLCPFCGLMLHRKNLQVHLRRKHPEQVSSQEKPAPAQVKNLKQQRLPLRQQQKIAMESEIRDVFRHCIRFPNPISASVIADEPVDTANEKRCITILTCWSQCDLERGVKLLFSQKWTLLCKHGIIEYVLPSGTSTYMQGALLRCQSPSGTLRAVVREEAVHQYLEVWGQNGLEKSFDLTALNKHGKVYEDAQFACLAWSPCEKKLLYVAEKKRVEPSGLSSLGSANEDGGIVLLEEQDKNLYAEDWGEGLMGKCCPVLCVVDLNKGAVIVYAGVPPHISPGQALWAPNGRGVLFVGQWNEPFRLGLKFCSNRRSALYYLDLKGNCECLSSEGVSVLSPRMSPDSCWIVYLQGQVFGPHHQCLSMMLYDMKNRTTSVLVDVVRRAVKGQFAGIYESLPSHCWSADSERIFFSSACENYKAVFSVNRCTGRVTQVCGTDALRLDDFGSVQLLTIQKDMMVMSCSSPNQPPCLRVGFLSSVDHAEDMQLYNLGRANVYEGFDWQPMLITPPSQEENHQFSDLNFGAILLKPYAPERRKTPLVVNIHGGPHSHFAAEWNATAAALSKLGFAILMVNYRGSTGFGQDSIESLLGNVGIQDVKDVQRAVLCALQNDATLDPDRIAVMGGSHGGFLACHLIGQYPDFYRVCAARNPVINAATLLGTTDILDWRYSSVGIQYSFDLLPTSQSLTDMLEKSPIIHAAQIRAPVLLMLGGRDRRVSSHQGLELYKALRSRNTPVRLLWYSDEGHSLSKVSTQSDCFFNIVLWFKEHLN